MNSIWILTSRSFTGGGTTTSRKWIPWFYYEAWGEKSFSGNWSIETNIIKLINDHTHQKLHILGESLKYPNCNIRIFYCSYTLHIEFRTLCTIADIPKYQPYRQFLAWLFSPFCSQHLFILIIAKHLHCSSFIWCGRCIYTETEYISASVHVRVGVA